MSKPENDGEFAAWVRSRRAHLRLSQEELGKLAGVSRFTISRIERGYVAHPLVATAVSGALRIDESRGRAT
jgi:DNA-binding XRE family transcriptional regulator